MSKDDYYIEIEDDVDEVEFDVGPKPKKQKPIFTKEEKKKLKFWTIILIIALILVFYELIVAYLQDLLRANPTVHKFYLNVEHEIRSSTLKGLLYVSILGSFFFLAFPGEALFVYYLSATNYFFIIVIIMMTLGNIVGLSFNYFLGRMLGQNLVEKMFKKNHEKYEKRIEKYGGYVLFFGNIIPGPIELLTVFYGAFKYDYSRYVYLCFMGRLIKYIIIFTLFTFYWDSITIFYEDIKMNGASMAYGFVISLFS